MEKIIFHIDVNNAFLSWSAVELLKKGNPKDIRDEVCVIGGDEEKRNGIVLAKSTPAKKYGIVTAEPLLSAKKKYPKLKIYPPDYTAYYDYSYKLYQYLNNLTSSVEQYSVDECYLDFTGLKEVYDNPTLYALNLKDKIKNKFGYTVNIGIGNNKLCAKMASDFEKPDKVHTLYLSEIETKLWPLSVDELFMVGKKSATKLHQLGINTIGELAKYPKEKILQEFKNYGIMLYEYSNGIDNSTVENSADLKGIGNSYTYPYDLNNIVDIKDKLFQLSTIVGRRLRLSNKKATVISLWVKYSNFNTINKQMKLNTPIYSDLDIYNNILKIVKNIKIEPIRSLGIRLTSFKEDDCKQISLFDTENTDTKPNKELDYVVDNLKNKYGENIIKKGMCR